MKENNTVSNKTRDIVLKIRKAAPNNPWKNLEAGATSCCISILFFIYYFSLTLILYARMRFLLIIWAILHVVKKYDPPLHLPTGQAGPSREGTF
jgi:hypothetical protein